MVAAISGCLGSGSTAVFIRCCFLRSADDDDNGRYIGITWDNIPNISKQLLIMMVDV